MDRADDEVPREGGVDGSGNSLRIAHFPDHDHIGVLAERAAERGREPAFARGIDLPLGNHGFAVGIDELDRVLQREDMLVHSAVDVVDHGGERGGFAAARGTRNQDQAARSLGKSVQQRRQIQVGDIDVVAVPDRTYGRGRTADGPEEIHADAAASRKPPRSVERAGRRIGRFAAFPDNRQTKCVQRFGGNRIEGTGGTHDAADACKRLFPGSKKKIGNARCGGKL